MACEKKRRTWSRTGAALTALCLFCTPAFAEDKQGAGVALRVIESNDGLKTPEKLSAARKKALTLQVAELKKAILEEPKKRELRFELVRAQMKQGQLESALESAQSWRAVDAYNLVVVRLIGDLQSDLQRPEQALRTYSAVVELLAEDPDAQRALATVLKSNGKFEDAAERLESAHHLRPDDPRIIFEWADVMMRRGKNEKAEELFRRIIDNDKSPSSVVYPAKQRLGQLLAGRKRLAKSAKESAELGREIQGLKLSGGVNNDIKIYLSWDTDRTDVDLWVTTPSGEKIFYSHREGKNGGALYDDVTSGYGPESFTAKNAIPGTYTVQVNYFSSRRSTFQEARGEVQIVLHEGGADEARHVIPYRLEKAKETITVAKIEAVATSAARPARKGQES